VVQREEDARMKIDLSALRQAIAQLEEALAYCGSEQARQDTRLALHLRAAAIQAFEYTYELSVRMLRRYLESTESNPAAIAELTFNDLIRLGWERGLLRAELAAWKEFRRSRSITSHTYDQAKALEVFEGIPAFLDEVRLLCAAIEERQEQQE
jgi:nucleotidyltransferase substrate binding protein (TIGR01987 family)